MSKIVYTIGHSNRSIEEFVNILKRYNIKLVIDVRRFPTSRKYPWFNRDFLEKYLKNLDIGYVWLGEYLGGFREGGYENYMKTEQYRYGISLLVRYIENLDHGFCTIMCSERLWFRCHRRYISNTLVEFGYDVIHIIDIDKVQKHRVYK